MADKEKKTARVRITKKVIDGIKRPKKGQFFLRDIELLGFGVRFTPGSTSFILEKRIKGRMRRISLGPYGGLTLEDAQNKAKRMIGEIADGKDPAEDRLEQKREPTFGDLIEAYKERHLPRKKSAKNDELQIGAHLDGWKNRKLSAITRREVSRLHSDLGEKSGPYAANRVVALLRKMFNLGQIWGMFKGENPGTGIGMFPEKKRERFVHPDELPRLMEALKGEENFYIRAAFLVCLFTGARKGEVLSMRWEDVDLAQGIWRIPETKAGRSHLVPLPAPVVELLRNLPLVHNNPYVFSGRKGNQWSISINPGVK